MMLTTAGCMGEIGGTLAAPDPTNVDTLAVCETTPARGLAFNHLRRLSSTAITNTLAALLGSEIIADGAITDALSGIPRDATILAGDFVEDPPPVLAQTLRSVATRATTLALANRTWRTGHFPACAASAITTEACASETIRSFGARVMRRDLTDDETTRQLELYRASGSGEAGFAFVMRRLLQSPALTFHIENGTSSEDGSIRLNEFEIASRISYLVADTMPDDELLEAARTGQLQSLESVAEHVRRLLTTPEAHAKARDFFRYYTHLSSDGVPDPLAIHGARLGITDTAGLGQEMYDEALAFFEHIFWDEDAGTFHELMTSTTSYSDSTSIARILGTGERHVGLAHRPALLTSPTERTSPIVRGVHIRKLFLCEELGSPPFELVSARQGEVGDIDNMSNRDSVHVLTDSPICMGCHAGINQTGFAFEGFDQLGAPRTEEVILADNGTVKATWPLDTTIEDGRLGSEPESFSSSEDLMYAVASSEMGRACITKRLFQYYRASQVAKADACSVSQAEALSADKSIQSVLVALIANEDIFWRKEPTQ